LVDGLPSGKYEAEFTMAYETAEPVNEYFSPDHEVNAVRLGERLWKLTYSFELKDGEYKYKQLRVK